MNIKTWRERYQEDVDCKPYGVAGEIEEYMQSEIDDLIEALKTAQESCAANAKAAEDYYRENNQLRGRLVCIEQENKELKIHFANLEQESDMLYQDMLSQRDSLLTEKQSLLDQRESWRCLASKFELERDELQSKLQELNLQYISDFGQLQEKEPESTLSWNGFNVHGDKKSMGEVLRLVERCTSLEQYLKVGATSTEVHLWDSQWINVVNHDHCYEAWDKEEAIAHAVTMTEKLIAKNVAENNLPPKRKETNNV